MTTAPAQYVARFNDPAGFRCYGAARQLWEHQGPEVVLAGPFETGKTIAALHKVHATLAKHAGARWLMVRKTYNSLINSAVATYENKVLPAPPHDTSCPVSKYGGARPEFYEYPNGSRLVLGGMDKPEKLLSSEWDGVYVNQAEEFTLNEWEMLTARTTGRAGAMPYAIVMGDCNPGPPRHWIRGRGRLDLLHSKHEDNPILFDRKTGNITEQGKRTMAVLDALTGVRYKRGRLGLWAGAEGQVYEGWNDEVHLIDRFDIPADWRRFRVVDFGYTNPFVCQWFAVDDDGRMYLYREIYMTRRTVNVHARQIKELSEGETIEATVCDHDAEDRATLEEHGIYTRAADKRVSVGIEKVQERLRVQGDGKPRFYVLRDSLAEPDSDLVDRHKPLWSADEVTGYVFPDSKAHRAEDEKPVKVDDHGMDGWRYGVMYVDATIGSAHSYAFVEW